MTCDACPVRAYLNRHRRALEAERGPVPLAVVATLGASASSGDHAWALPPRVAARLGVPSRSYTRHEIWAGCRWTLELARSVQRQTGLAGPALWREVVRVEAPHLSPVLDSLGLPLDTDDRQPPKPPLRRVGDVVRAVSALGWIAGRVGVAAMRARSVVESLGV